MMAKTTDLPTQLVTGASSGIGLAICRHLLGTTPDHVVAVARGAGDSEQLAALHASYPSRLHRVSCDITNQRQRLSLQQRLPAGSLVRVINCAGLLHQGADNIWPEKRVEDLDADTLHTLFAVNAFAPVLLARDLLSRMPKGAPCLYASLSARVGSISDNRLGGWYGYRAAKAAQNQLLKTFAIEMRRRRPQLCVLLMHPGTTDTPLSQPFQGNVPTGKLFTSENVARQLVDLMDKARAEDSGRFLAFDGRDIPW